MDHPKTSKATFLRLSHDTVLRAGVPRRATLCVLLATGAANAQSTVPQPPINTGTSSFLDADGGPGTLLQSTNAYYKATRVVDSNGDRLPGPFRQDVETTLFHIAHTTRYQLAGAFAGFEVLLPVVRVHVETPGLDATRTGVGDLIVGAVLQWSDFALGDGRVSVRADLDVIAPTGQYSRGRPLNAGLNLWELSPYVAMTWHATEKWEVSGRLTYNWSQANDRPPTASGAHSEQAGQQTSLNLATSYVVAPGWRLGPAVYGVQQLTAAKVDGQSIPGFKQRAWGAGPGIHWTSGHLFAVANLYKEFAVRNRTDGYTAVVRFAAVF